MNIRNREVVHEPESADITQQKRNPRKLTQLKRGSVRTRKEVEYEDEKEDSFKKPTPQKHRKYSDESESTPFSNGEFKISLDGSSRSLRRSTRNKSQVAYNGIIDFSNAKLGTLVTICGANLRTVEHEENKISSRELRARRREMKEKNKGDSPFDLNNEVKKLDRKQLR